MNNLQQSTNTLPARRATAHSAPAGKFTFALFAGRHPLPDHNGGAIYESYDWQQRQAVRSKPGFSRALSALNAGQMIHVYVTGLTPALCEFVNASLNTPGGVTLWHYDRDGRTYWPQVLKSVQSNPVLDIQ